MPRTSEDPGHGSPRHSATVRLTHWVTTLAFCALLLSGIEITISHPRFYWGETGNVNMAPLFTLPIPSSRATVPTGYRVLPDQNGWSRSLHFEAAWVLLFAGLIYVAISLWSGHLRRDLLPQAGTRNWRAFRGVFAGYLGNRKPRASAPYNVVQRTVYVLVVFALFPLLIWTGLALSPALDSAYPFLVTILGGRQSARTLHFFLSWAAVLFLFTHVAMVIHAGFRSHMRAMIFGKAAEEDASPLPARSSEISALEQP